MLPMWVVEQAIQPVNPIGAVLPELGRQSAKMASARLSKSPTALARFARYVLIYGILRM
jgi:hypothetical protein